MDYPAEVRLEVYDAVIDYVASGTTTELKPQAKMAFSFIKKQIDNNNERFEEIVSKRSAAGKKGGGNPAFKKGHPNPYYQDINDLSENEKINNRPINIIISCCFKLLPLTLFFLLLSVKNIMPKGIK